MESLILVYITNSSKEEAEKVAEHLIRKKLIACANIHEVTSIYPWEGKLARENEFVLIAKSVAEKFEAIKEEVKEIHSYKIPCIIKIPVESNKEYSEWVKSSLG